MKIKNLFKSWAKLCAQKRRNEAIEQVNRDVQLREFEGKIWLCYNDVPIVEQGQLKKDICDAVTDARLAVCRYYKLLSC